MSSANTSLQRMLRIDRGIDSVLPSVAAVLATTHGRSYVPARAVAISAIATAAWLFVARVLRQYDADNGRSVRGDVALTAVLLGSVLVPCSLIAWTLSWPAAPAEIGRLAALLVPASWIARVVLVDVRLRPPRPHAEILVAGTGPLGRHTGNEILDGDGRKHLTGYLRFEDEPVHDRLHADLLGTVDQLERILRDRVVDEVVFASMAPAHAAAVQEGVHACECFGVPFALPACTYRISRAMPERPDAVDDGYVHYVITPPKPLQLALKRAFDILSSFAALMLLSPVLVAAAVAVKLTSRGPVLFRQERCGLHGRRFRMLKFRSMVVDAEARQAALVARNEQTGPVFKMKRDPRVTPVGRLLRKYSIDELPQLVNVLRGDMSIVGPRPPIPSEVARYEAWQRRRLSVRPGLTCVWQVSGRNEISFEDWMMLDLRYIDHWSFVRDLALVVDTVPVVLTGRGAS